ncbi:MAG: GAF domain-containing protein [Mycobacterium sp.]
MRSRRDDVDVRATVDRARKLNLCGFGGVLTPPPSDLRSALVRADEQYDERVARRIARFADVVVGSLAWTRGGDGLFWLGRLEGPYFYDAGGAAVDLVHVRRCRWLSTPLLERDVPAAVVATFRRGGRNFQQTHDPDVGAQSQRLWDERG